MISEVKKNLPNKLPGASIYTEKTKAKNLFKKLRYIVHAKNGIFAIFSALAISKNVIISDISGQTLFFSLLTLLLLCVSPTFYLKSFTQSYKVFTLLCKGEFHNWWWSINSLKAGNIEFNLITPAFSEEMLGKATVSTIFGLSLPSQQMLESAGLKVSVAVHFKERSNDQD